MTCPSPQGCSSLPNSGRIWASTSLKHCDACVRAYAFSLLRRGSSPMKGFAFATGRQGRCGAYMD
jgi:hypothetical protein